MGQADDLKRAIAKALEANEPRATAELLSAIAAEVGCKYKFNSGMGGFLCEKTLLLVHLSGTELRLQKPSPRLTTGSFDLNDPNFISKIIDFIREP